MSVKSSTTGSRVLATLECIARHQPVGVTELSRLMDTDKSALQRALVTLADEGWIYAAPGGPTRWQLTGHIHLVAHMAHGSSGLRHRARPALEALRDATGETAGLAVADIGRFVVIDVVESRQMLRMAPNIGMVVITGDSATGRAVLPYLPRERQIELLGARPTAALERDFMTTLRQGYFVSENDHIGQSINVAAPVFETDGSPVAAVILSAPRERLTPKDYARVGSMVLRTAQQLSLGRPQATPVITARGRARPTRTTARAG